MYCVDAQRTDITEALPLRRALAPPLAPALAPTEPGIDHEAKSAAERGLSEIRDIKNRIKKNKKI